MSKSKHLVMVSALAAALTLATACFNLFAGDNTPATEAEIAACAGLSGPARIDCEARHGKP
jgi:uncharacterized membrane protein